MKSPPESFPGIAADDLRRWQSAWGRARSFAPATEVEGVLHVDIGLQGRSMEYVVIDADEHPRRIDRAASSALGARDPWVTVPTRDAARTADRLQEHGLRTPPLPEWMMTIKLVDQRRVRLADGYGWDLEETDGVLHLVVTGPADEVAATGQLAVVDHCAVPDKIETADGHRRRGLGGSMMTVLAEAAVDLGATRGLLMASTQGRGLYATLGWTTLCPVVVGRLWE